MMKITCVECGTTFEFSKGEQYFYAYKGFAEPKRCPTCRKYSASSIVGLKRNTFFDSVSIYGVPVCVNYGQPTVEHAFKIALDGEKGRLYFAVKDKKIVWVKNDKEAILFNNKTIAQENIEKIANFMNMAKEKFIALPYAYWAEKMHIK